MKKENGIDKEGRVVIPKGIRTELGISSGDALDIYSKDGCVIIKKHNVSCHFCGKEDMLLEFREKKVCKDCLEDIKAL